VDQIAEFLEYRRPIDTPHRRSSDSSRNPMVTKRPVIPPIGLIVSTAVSRPIIRLNEAGMPALLCKSERHQRFRRVALKLETGATNNIPCL